MEVGQCGRPKHLLGFTGEEEKLPSFFQLRPPIGSWTHIQRKGVSFLFLRFFFIQGSTRMDSGSRR